MISLLGNRNNSPLFAKFPSIFGINNSPEATDLELGLIGNSSFRFGKSGIGQRTDTLSKGKQISRVSQNDYNKLLNLDLFRGGQVSDVTDTKLSTATFRKNRKTGDIFRSGGPELSNLNEQSIEQLAQVVAGRQAQLQSAAFTPGLARQSFSLLSGNFS